MRPPKTWHVNEQQITCPLGLEGVGNTGHSKRDCMGDWQAYCGGKKPSHNSVIGGAMKAAQQGDYGAEAWLQVCAPDVLDDLLNAAEDETLCVILQGTHEAELDHLIAIAWEDF